MPLVTQMGKDDWTRSTRKVLINGAPITGKTTSLLTFPAPRHIVVAPDEQGYTSIISDNKDTFLYRLEGETNAIAALSKFEIDLKTAIRATPTPQTVGVDGLHKLFEAVMKSEGWTPDSDPKEFTRYHDKFVGVLRMLLGSNVPYKVATVYDGPEVVDPTAEKKESKIYPDLPGKMAKRIMGEFPFVLHTMTLGQGKSKKFLWQLESTDSVRGAGVHLPKEVAAKLPTTIEQDWGKLEQLINAI